MKLRDKVILIAVDVPWLSERLAQVVMENGAVPCVLDDEVPIKYLLAREVGGTGCQGMIEWVRSVFGKVDGMIAGLTVVGSGSVWPMGQRIASLAIPYLRESEGVIVHLLESDFHGFYRKRIESTIDPFDSGVRTNAVVLPKGWDDNPENISGHLAESVIHFLSEHAKDEVGICSVIPA